MAQSGGGPGSGCCLHGFGDWWCHLTPSCSYCLLPVGRPLVLLLGPPEFFMLVMLGVAMVGALSGKSYVKGISAGLLGFAISMIGIETQTAVPRFTFELIYLFDGIGLVPLSIGLFAIPELIFLASQKTTVSKVPLLDLKEGRMQGIRGCWDHKWLLIVTAAALSVCGSACYPRLGLCRG